MAKATTGAFDFVQDVGAPAIAGKTVYDSERQEYRVTGAGANIWGTRDEFHFAALRLKGNAILTVEGRLEGEGVDAHRKWGLMLRQSLAGDSAYADAVVHGDGLTSLQYRKASGAETLEVKFPLTAPDVIQLERHGGEVILRAAQRGEPLIERGRIELYDLDAEVYAGLFVCSHNASVLETAVFHNFRVDVPATAEAGSDTLSPSRLELLDVATGHRRVVYTSRAHFEAPNWSRDGRFLLFNQDGRIYRLNLGARTPVLLDTGPVIENNNDHGISFDGRWLALSSRTVQAGRKTGSQIYVVPIEGGSPRKVTDEAPSYWHGWSPDGKTLVYCAERNDSYDVWSIGVNGGPETRLTTTPGLDDGPEFSPDGAYVYFNSTRTGHMKIWRMKPNGEGQEQVSFGDDNDWFAHISPDNTRLVYVSYPPTVPAALHPMNQRVSLREQSLTTGKVRVLAHLYGGQGTLNVPSWSPDGKTIAFVSYTFGNPEVER
jgi:Tol biopolymer transport system component